jgi:hypothetical protein
MIKSLEDVLAYQNKWVLKRFKQACHWFEGTDEEAQLIFEDLKRFLWLYASVEQERKENPDLDLADISIADNMEIIDEMWHAFILYTQFYEEFCQKYFGMYMHHPVPCEKYISNIKQLGHPRAKEIFVTEMVECVLDQFGEEIAIRWFDEYERFNSPESTTSEHHVTAQGE